MGFQTASLMRGFRKIQFISTHSRRIQLRTCNRIGCHGDNALESRVVFGGFPVRISGGHRVFWPRFPRDYSTLPGKCWDSTLIRPRQLPSRSFPLHYSSDIHIIRRNIVSMLNAYILRTYENLKRRRGPATANWRHITCDTLLTWWTKDLLKDTPNSVQVSYKILRILQIILRWRLR
jgi:hypothetical protein